MSSTNATLEADPVRSRSMATPFLTLMVFGLLVCILAALRGDAPIFTGGFSDLLHNMTLWFRAEMVWGGIFACALAVSVIGLVGLLLSLIARKPNRPAVAKSERAPREAPVVAAAMAYPAVVADDPLHVPATEDMDAVAPARSDARGSLSFNAQSFSDAPGEAPEPVQLDMPVSLEPAIFHDNASDSFLSREAVTPAPTARFDPAAALSDHHGLSIGRVEPAAVETPVVEAVSNVVPIRPDIAPDILTAGQPEGPLDPMESALLAEPIHSPSPPPQSDINAVIASARRFADAIDDAPVAEPVAAAPESPPAPPVVDSDTEIRQTIQTALSVWPDATRAIAADELSVRIHHLFHDRDPQSQRIFQLIASGDLSAAAAGLSAHAEALTQQGRPLEAAELWRVHGALHMGRDDARALSAYAHVSELDPSDANIHLYLTRRYQMAGDTAKMPAVIMRALNVISDPAVRTELLTPYADLQMKAGNLSDGAEALAELVRLHETNALLKPDDIAARSAHAITLARLAQAREMQGAFDQAGPLYKKAHQVFADLSAHKPDHPGLRAMADNALKDAQRFGA